MRLQGELKRRDVQYYKQYKMYCEAHGVREFRIPKIPRTTNKTIRFPNDVIERVEKVIVGKDCTFTAFVVEAVRVALDNLDEEDG